MLHNFVSLRAFTVYMENSLRSEISFRSNCPKWNLHWSKLHFAWTVIIKLPYTEVKFYPKVKSQTSFNSLRVPLNMLYVKIIWICQCFPFFSAQYLVAFIVLSYLLHRYAALFVYFYRNQLCSPAINQTSLKQSKGWISSILVWGQEKYHEKSPLGLYINYIYKILPVYI